MTDISAVSLYESRTLCTQSDPSSSSDGALELAESSTHGSSKPSTEVEEQLKEIKIGQDETSAVARSKRLVYLVLLACAFAAATVTWFFVRTEERHEFENEFRDLGESILEAAELNIAAIVGQLHSTAITVTSLAGTTKQPWPFVTIPDYEERSAETKSLSSADMVMFAPVVNPGEIAAWNEYAFHNENWTTTNFFIGSTDIDHDEQESERDEHDSRDLYTFDGNIAVEGDATLYTPVWQFGPNVLDPSLINLDLHSHPVIKRVIDDVQLLNESLISEIFDVTFVLGFTEANQRVDDIPRSVVVQAVHETFDETSRVVGYLIAVEAWTHFFERALPHGVDGFIVDIKSSCGPEFTFQVDGPDATFVGQGDLHNSKYDDISLSSVFSPFRSRGEEYDATHCQKTLHVYPSELFEAPFHTNKPYLYAGAVLLMFSITCGVFLFYDYTVQRRQQKVLGAAQRTTRIVQSLFPEEVGNKIIEQAEKEERDNLNKKKPSLMAKKQLQNYLDGDAPNSNNLQQDPIADFFSDTTIMFADISGFTAWSSAREPKQVFLLLETVFGEFDRIAKRRRVFKVETVGDCYVAVVGLPEPRKDHAPNMARYARDCMYAFKGLTQKLEAELGPATADLGIRIGLHSGPVTAGVLRGDKARFQLFGDTINTASRIETTGKSNRIHVSQETADALTAAGKGHWLQARTDKVEAKGKGELQTYWLDFRSASSASGTSASSESTQSDGHPDEDYKPTKSDKKSASSRHTLLETKNSRLVQWNYDILSRFLRQIIAYRIDSGMPPASSAELYKLEAVDLRQSGPNVLDATKTAISMPRFNAQAARKKTDPSSIEVDPVVAKQLNEYVRVISALYHDAPFHNFEHATHVTMSVVKLLSRLVAPDVEADTEDSHDRLVHDHTYGITSDPLISFTVVLAALLHDVDHQGVPNSQLVNEGAAVAKVYQGRSVAEQNSFSVAWSLLMEDSYTELRHTIYANSTEFQRFKQLSINSILATDIMDKELGALRKDRWNAAFAEQSNGNMAPDVNFKASIVIEHLIQASDVAHTMQHWQIYRKWNERFFEECYAAYRAGRADKDPTEVWYQGELGFFDYYIIPLAKKLGSCGVFGVSCDEYLNYAKQNRKEWASKGQEIVAAMAERVREQEKAS